MTNSFLSRTTQSLSGSRLLGVLRTILAQGFDRSCLWPVPSRTNQALAPFQRRLNIALCDESRHRLLHCREACVAWLVTKASARLVNR